MSKWPKVTLSELLRRSEETAILAPDAEYHEVTIKLWGKGVISRGKVRGSEVSTKRRVVRTNQLIMSKIDARNGAIGLVPPELDGAIVSNDFPSFTFHDPSKCHPAFMGWMVRSTSFVELCKASSEGTTNRVRIKEERFLNQKIALPPLAEQQAIVMRLNALADKVQQVNEHLDAIEAHVERLLIAMATRDDLTQEQKQAKGWRQITVSDIASLKLRPQPVSIDKSYPNVGIYSFARGLFSKMSIEGGTTSAKTLYQISAGQFIYSRLFAFEGAYALVTPEFDGYFVSNEFPTFDVDPKKATPEFLLALFSSKKIWSDVAMNSQGLGDRRQRVQPDQILKYKIWLPPLEEQKKLSRIFPKIREMKTSVEKRRQQVNALIPAVLERLFKERPAPAIHKVNDNFYHRAAVDAYIVHALADDPHLGRTKLEKISHLIEYHCRFNLNRQPVRDAYGPNDYPSRRKVEDFASKQNWFACLNASNRAGVTYVPGERIADALPVAVDALADRKSAVDALIELLRPLDTKQCEIIATLYAAWNDLLLRGEHPSDKTLLLEATERWHPNKLSIPASRWHKGIEWLRANEIIPIGQGRPVPEKKETSQ